MCTLLPLWSKGEPICEPDYEILQEIQTFYDTLRSTVASDKLDIPFPSREKRDVAGEQSLIFLFQNSNDIYTQKRTKNNG